MEQTTQQLHQLRESQELTRSRDARARALAALTKKSRSGADELAGLKRQAQAEEALGHRSLARNAGLSGADATELHWAARQLSWPVTGTIAAHYQDARNGVSGSRLNGILIETTRGSKVRAPYFGRVVYADWLQGLGLLLIIGQSGNFMTLYGHAEVLYKTVGDWVAPGDVIASMPDLPSAAPQLYIEIRAGRRAVDPKSWLKPSP